jgi:hypothetical protein
MWSNTSVHSPEDKGVQLLSNMMMALRRDEQDAILE